MPNGSVEPPALVLAKPGLGKADCIKVLSAARETGLFENVSLLIARKEHARQLQVLIVHRVFEASPRQRIEVERREGRKVVAERRCIADCIHESDCMRK